MSFTGTRTPRWAVGVGLFAALMLLLGCGGNDDTASTNPEPASDTAESDLASAEDDFPIPRPDGLVLDALADSGIVSPGQRQLYYAGDDFDRVVAFYDDWTAGDDAWMRTESGGIVVYSRSETESVFTISITPDHDPGAQADGPVTYVLLIANI